MEDVAKITGLIRRENTYYVRVRVPKDLLSLYAPKKEITKSLGTKNYSDAVLKYKHAQASIQADFELKRKSAPNGKPLTDMLLTLSKETLTSFAQDWCEAAWEKAEQNHASQTKTYTVAERDEIRETLFMETVLAKDEVLNLSNPYNGHSQWSGSIIADEILQAKGISFNKGTEQYESFRFICSRAHLEYTVRHLNFWDGKKHKATAPIFAKGKVHQANSAPVNMGQTNGKPVPLSKLYQEYINNPSAEMSDSTKKNYTIPIRVLMHVVGEHRPIHEITREECKKVRELLRVLPANYKKKLGNLGIVEAIKKGAEQNLGMASVGTINGHLQKISALLNYAVSEGYIQVNPARDLLVKDKESAKEKRHPFDMAVLQTIFSSGVYSGPDISIYKEYEIKKKSEIVRYSYFWVPLIALFTGMRLNEICQLHVSDIQEKAGVDFINVRTETDESDNADGEQAKKLKTAQSIRVVPIHPVLKQIGLLKYAASFGKSGNTQLFPDIKEATTGYMSGNFSKYYSRNLKLIGVKTKKTSFHSFRHNFRDAEREAEIPEPISQQLGGWTTGKTDANYGQGVKVETLAKWMDRIEYPELDLNKLFD